MSVADIKAKIIAEEYFTLGEALDALGLSKPSGADVLTICVLTIANGFMVLGKSAPADPANFDIATGRILAYDEAYRQVWSLEGYVLRDRLAAQP